MSVSTDHSIAMFNPVGLVFILLWASVLAENCVTNNFDDDSDFPLTSDTNICTNGQPWQWENYTLTDITGIPPGSKRFIEPMSALSCGSTPLYAMSEGTLEVKFYMQANSLGDFLSVFVSERVNDQEVVHGQASFSQKTSDYKNGWNVLKIHLYSPFTGYISFMGERSEGSIVLVDSFRFYAQSYEEECQIYTTDEIRDTDQYTESTTEITWNPNPEIDSTIDPETVATTEAVETEKCVTYNFDADFDKLFTHKHDLCNSFDTWELNNYATDAEETRNAKGRSYLTPNEDLSCISAFPIRMSPNGIVEVNVYIEPASELDYIIVLVKNVVQNSVDTVAGSYIYEPSVSTFVKGWNVLRINVVNLRSFDGYLVLLGAASQGSTVLVDSFRYIPPWASADDEECQIR